MRGERVVDPREQLGMSQHVLRHPSRPAVDARKHGLRRYAEERELTASEPDQVGVRVRRDVAPAEPTRVDPQQDAVVRRTRLPLLR